MSEKTWSFVLYAVAPAIDSVVSAAFRRMDSDMMKDPGSLSQPNESNVLEGRDRTLIPCQSCQWHWTEALRSHRECLRIYLHQYLPSQRSSSPLASLCGDSRYSRQCPPHVSQMCRDLRGHQPFSANANLAFRSFGVTIQNAECEIRCTIADQILRMACYVSNFADASSITHSHCIFVANVGPLLVDSDLGKLPPSWPRYQ